MTPKKRHKARTILVQALYQWAMTQDSLANIEAQFCASNDVAHLDIDYFRELLHAIPAELSDTDESFKPFLERDFTEVNPVELAILRVSSYELKHRLDIPYKVIINEGIEMAKIFGAEDSHKFINSVLDRLAQSVRGAETRN